MGDMTTAGIKLNTEKIKIIKHLKMPKTTKEIKSFSGITGFFRKFMNNYAKIASPFTDVLMKDKDLDVGNPKFIAAFEKSKELLTNYPVLKNSNF